MGVNQEITQVKWSCSCVLCVVLESPLLLVVVTPSVNIFMYKPTLFLTCWHFDNTPCAPTSLRPQTQSKKELKGASLQSGLILVGLYNLDLIICMVGTE